MYAPSDETFVTTWLLSIEDVVASIWFGHETGTNNIIP
jgi:hypothetical protein